MLTPLGRGLHVFFLTFIFNSHLQERYSFCSCGRHDNLHESFYFFLFHAVYQHLYNTTCSLIVSLPRIKIYHFNIIYSFSCVNSHICDIPSMPTQPSRAGKSHQTNLSSIFPHLFGQGHIVCSFIEISFQNGPHNRKTTPYQRKKKVNAFTRQFTECYMHHLR